MIKAKIDAIETVIVDLPLRRTQRFSRLAAMQQSSVVIRIRTDQGVEGIGESVTPCGPWWGGDSIESIKVTIDTYLAPLLIGRNPLEPNVLMAELNTRVRGSTFAMAGLEMAMLDCAGKLLDVPVYALLGGKARSSLEVAWPLAQGDVATDVAEAEAKMERGQAHIFKVKMGALPIEEDIARSVAIARALSGRAKVRVDPNEAWDEVTAVRVLAPLEDAGIDVIEQPVARWNHDAMARLTRSARCAIMVDEGVRSSHDLVEVVKRRAAGLVSLKIMKTGGIRAARTIADIAVAAGIPVYIGTFLETSLGTAANMHLAASLGELPYGGEATGPMLIANDICTEPADYHDFALWLPEGPGLGVALDPERMSYFRREGSRHSYAVAGAQLDNEDEAPPVQPAGLSK